jgi:hypothetical protein
MYARGRMYSGTLINKTYWRWKDAKLDEGSEVFPDKNKA